MPGAARERRRAGGTSSIAGGAWRRWTAAPDREIFFYEPVMPIPARRTHRLETWLWTGPLGHLVGGTLDLAEALARYARFRLTGRTPR